MLNMGLIKIQAQTLDFTFNYDSAGNRTWRVMDPIEKKIDPDIKDHPFSDSSSSLNLDASVYPNPTHGKVVITVSNMQSGCKLNICLYDTWNNLILNLESYNPNIDLDLKTLSKGIYYLRITSGQYSYKEVIILE
jgi:hypothetical protein